MAGQCAPAQTYWSVEYVEVVNTVRFGTYGRGIWDFVIDDVVPATAQEPTNENFNVFPNPSSGIVQLEMESPRSNQLNITVLNLQGRQMYSTNRPTTPGHPLRTTLNLSDLNKGPYIIHLQDGHHTKTQKLLIQ